MTDLVRVTYSGGPSGDWLTQFHIDRIPLGTAQDSVTLVTSFLNAYKASMSNVITAHVSASVEQVDPISGQPTGVSVVTPATVAGTDANDPLPYQTQGLIIWNTGVWVGGRQVRGKTYLPGPTEVSNGGGVPFGTYMTNLAAAAAVFTGAAIAVPSIYSRTHHNTFPIVSATVNAKWAVLRTRR